LIFIVWLMEKMMAILNRFSEMFEEISTWRRDLHAHPELRFEEYRTAGHCQTKRG
jgi:hippurate hydrolase